MERKLIESTKKNNRIVCRCDNEVMICEDVVIKILRRLSSKNLLKFKCVSRDWRDLISDLVIPKLLPLRLLGIYVFKVSTRRTIRQYVSMVDEEDDNTGDRFYNMWPCSPFSQPNHRRRRLRRHRDDISTCSLSLKPPELDLIGCCDGLFLFQSRLLCQYYLWTRELPQFVKIHSPPSQEGEEPNGAFAALAFNTRESVHYKIVRFKHKPPYSSQSSRIIDYLDIFYSETGKWIRFNVEFKLPSNSTRWISSCIYFDGSLYRLLNSGHLIRFSLKEMNITAIDLPKIGNFDNHDDVGEIGVSSGRLHYAKQDGISLMIWMYSDRQIDSSNWILKRSIAFQDFIKLPSIKDFFPDFLTAFDLRGTTILHPLAFHPYSDAVFVWAFAAIFLYDYEKNDSQKVFSPKFDGKFTLRRNLKPPVWVFPYSPCLIPLKSLD